MSDIRELTTDDVKVVKSPMERAFMHPVYGTPNPYTYSVFIHRDTKVIDKQKELMDKFENSAKLVMNATTPDGRVDHSKPRTILNSTLEEVARQSSLPKLAYKMGKKGGKKAAAVAGKFSWSLLCLTNAYLNREWAKGYFALKVGSPALVAAGFIAFSTYRKMDENELKETQQDTDHMIEIMDKMFSVRKSGLALTVMRSAFNTIGIFGTGVKNLLYSAAQWMWGIIIDWTEKLGDFVSRESLNFESFLSQNPTFMDYAQNLLLYFGEAMGLIVDLTINSIVKPLGRMLWDIIIIICTAGRHCVSRIMEYFNSPRISSTQKIIAACGISVTCAMFALFPILSFALPTFKALMAAKLPWTLGYIYPGRLMWGFVSFMQKATFAKLLFGSCLNNCKTNPIYIRDPENIHITQTQLQTICEKNCHSGAWWGLDQVVPSYDYSYSWGHLIGELSGGMPNAFNAAFLTIGVLSMVGSKIPSMRQRKKELENLPEPERNKRVEKWMILHNEEVEETLKTLESVKSTVIVEVYDKNMESVSEKKVVINPLKLTRIESLKNPLYVSEKSDGDECAGYSDSKCAYNHGRMLSLLNYTKGDLTGLIMEMAMMRIEAQERGTDEEVADVIRETELRTAKEIFLLDKDGKTLITSPCLEKEMKKREKIKLAIDSAMYAMTRDNKSFDLELESLVRPIFKTQDTKTIDQQVEIEKKLKVFMEEKKKKLREEEEKERQLQAIINEKLVLGTEASLSWYNARSADYQFQKELSNEKALKDRCNKNISAGDREFVYLLHMIAKDKFISDAEFHYNVYKMCLSVVTDIYGAKANATGQIYDPQITDLFTQHLKSLYSGKDLFTANTPAIPQTLIDKIRVALYSIWEWVATIPYTDYCDWTPSTRDLYNSHVIKINNAIEEVVYETHAYIQMITAIRDSDLRILREKQAVSSSNSAKQSENQTAQLSFEMNKSEQRDALEYLQHSMELKKQSKKL